MSPDRVRMQCAALSEIMRGFSEGIVEPTQDQACEIGKMLLAFPKMLEALEAAQEELVCPDAPSIGHRCGRCDEEVDRNQVVGGQIDVALRAAREAVKP